MLPILAALAVTLLSPLASFSQVKRPESTRQEGPPPVNQKNSSDSEANLTPLQSVSDLEEVARSYHMTLEKCEATAEAYGETPNPALLMSISDDQLHKLNLQAFACMKLGGQAFDYGWQIRNVVEGAIMTHVISSAIHQFGKDVIKIEADKLQQVIDQNNSIVDKYNGLVGKYNDLAASYTSLRAVAIRIAGYADDLRQANSRISAVETAQAIAAALTPTTPNRVYVQQAPLSCTAQRIGDFTYTHCH
jgi:hypothetical protein